MGCGEWVWFYRGFEVFFERDKEGFIDFLKGCREVLKGVGLF